MQNIAAIQFCQCQELTLKARTACVYDPLHYNKNEQFF